MITSPTDPSKKACERCRCPLLLLRLEKRRWENRRICARCGEPAGKRAPASISSLLEGAEDKRGKRSFRSALLALPEVEVPSKKKVDGKRKVVQSARPQDDSV